MSDLDPDRFTLRQADAIREDYAEFSEAQFDDAYPDGIEDHFWHLARNRLVEATLRRGLDREGRVLEVGCGRGLVLQHLRGGGFDCWGCELGRPPPIPARIRPFVFVEQDFRDLDPAFRSEVYGLLLLDVLEHIPDDISFLRALAEAFPRSRSLVLTVPSRRELWSNYDDHYGHFRRYDQVSLAAVLDKGGFPLVHQRYFFQELYAPMLLAAKLAGRRPTEVRSPTHPRLHRSIAVLSGLCSAIIPGSWPGASLVALASRRGSRPDAGPPLQ
jgi:SAM-dependent methyltransferase